ncbi:carbonic anhydrase [Elysia marginata]|uniref:Carbonic anhydrase n=1 Tax=Elysia marginata TaxID=1093978 RepID=A0AAV4F5M9_9GAST|nr:carbonic anhydrase [Elysia marginata]
MHIVAYNSDLYNNVSEAKREGKGLAIIAVFIEIGKTQHKSFYFIGEQLRWVKEKGKSRRVDFFSFSKLLPNTNEYITYEGSLTQPGCFETVTWIVLNKPLKISRKQLSQLRVLYHNHANEPGLPLSINARPLMPLNHRLLRTNINTHKRSKLCTMEKEMFYQGKV